MICIYDCSHTLPSECGPLTALPASVQHVSTPGCRALVRKSSHRLGSATAESAWRASRQHFIRRYPADRAPACQFSAAGVRDPAIRSSTSRPCWDVGATNGSVAFVGNAQHYHRTDGVRQRRRQPVPRMGMGVKPRAPRNEGPLSRSARRGPAMRSLRNSRSPRQEAPDDGSSTIAGA